MNVVSCHGCVPGNLDQNFPEKDFIVIPMMASLRASLRYQQLKWTGVQEADDHINHISIISKSESNLSHQPVAAHSGTSWHMCDSDVCNKIEIQKGLLSVKHVMIVESALVQRW